MEEKEMLAEINSAQEEIKESDQSEVTEAVSPVLDAENTDKKTETKPKKNAKRLATAYITKVAVLSAVATVLYFFARFPIFTVPPFNVLDMDFSDIPALIGGFALGPVASVIIAFIRCAVKLSTSTTAFVGELSAFVVSISFTLPATIIYKYK